MKISNEKLKKIYINMKRCRACDEAVMTAYRKGILPGFAHTSIGQEAVAPVVCSLLRKDDFVLVGHRGHSELIAKGGRVDRLMAEVLARETGYCKGKVGSMHVVAPEVNVIASSAIVGGPIPIASGVALACKMKNWDRVTVCIFGDGATFTGAFHEGLGVAAALDLPIVFVCNNNQFAISTRWSRVSKLKNLAERAKGYGIPGISVDGMDAIAMAEATSDAIERARKGGGPTLIEGRCTRYFGHGQYDPGVGVYRTKEEVEKWKRKDPIDRLYSFLLEEGLITEEKNREIEARVSSEIDEAVKFALESPEPSMDEVWRDVYSGIYK